MILVRRDDKLVNMKLGYASREMSRDAFFWGESEGNVLVSALASFGDVIFNFTDSVR